MRHPLPALDKIVVSEIGEQWSPKTEPAKVADKHTTVKLGSTEIATGTAIGIKIPNVPHAVPVEKDNNPAIMKITTGRK